MQFTTKFNIGDIVYIYRNKEVITRRVRKIEVSLARGSKVHARYICETLDGGSYNDWFSETELSTDKASLAIKLLADLGLTPGLTEI